MCWEREYLHTLVAKLIKKSIPFRDPESLLAYLRNPTVTLVISFKIF
jgi:hypothetical protein